jgi:hypothetical protein
MARRGVRWTRGKKKGSRWRIIGGRARRPRKAYNVYCGKGKGRKMGAPNFAYPSITMANAALRRISKRHSKCRVKQVRR